MIGKKVGRPPKNKTSSNTGQTENDDNSSQTDMDLNETKIIQISEIGLVEITRQREERNIYDMFTKQCLVCQGLGYKRNEKVYNKLPNYFIEITSVFG